MISGKWKSIPLDAPKGTQTRPTTDRVKESMFNLLPHVFSGTVLDLFAGSGALGIEALSRGAERAVFVERDRLAAQALRTNLAKVGATDQSVVLQMDWKRGLERVLETIGAVEWLFLDPPYRDMLWQPILKRLPADFVREGVVCETPSSLELAKREALFQMTKRKIYGDTAIAIFVPAHLEDVREEEL